MPGGSVGGRVAELAIVAEMRGVTVRVGNVEAGSGARRALAVPAIEGKTLERQFGF
jgi:hypothetical protein